MKSSTRMRADLVCIAVLAAYISGESGEIAITSPISSKDTFLEVTVFSFEEASCLVTVLTFTYIFKGNSFTGSRYCNKILLPYVRFFRDGMDPQLLFMGDNVPTHPTIALEELLDSEDIERMDRAARSPDLNPIVHEWDFLERCLAACNLSPVTITELRLVIQDEWAAMPQ